LKTCNAHHRKMKKRDGYDGKSPGGIKGQKLKGKREKKVGIRNVGWERGASAKKKL